MKKENISELEIKALSFTRINLEIETTFQDMETMKKVVEFNKQNDYKYAIVNDYNGIGTDLLSSDIVCYLINNDYVITSKHTDKKVEFKHKNLIQQEEEDREKIKEIRGY